MNDIKISKNLFRFDNDEIVVFYDHTDNFLLINSTLPENKIDIIKNGTFIIESLKCIKNTLNNIKNE